MVQVERYGLQWTIDALDPYQIVLKQGDGLTFLGELLIHPVWGPYIGVTRVRAFVNINNTYEKKECWLPNPQLFFVQELESMCDTKQVQWYYTLHEPYEKGMFKQSGDTWYEWYVFMSDLLKEETIDFSDAHFMFLFMEHTRCLDINNVSVSINKSIPLPIGKVALYIGNSIYEQLPDPWTIEDIYNADKEYHDQVKQEHEQLWYSIAQARQTNQPVKIVVEDDSTEARYIYTEQKTPHGLILPIVIPYDRERER